MRDKMTHTVVPAGPAPPASSSTGNSTGSGSGGPVPPPTDPNQQSAPPPGPVPPPSTSDNARGSDGQDNVSDVARTDETSTERRSDNEPVQHDEGENADPETIFPVDKLAKLDDMINRPRWVVPVLPDGELEILLKSAIHLSQNGLDNQSQSCQNFYKDGLTLSFTKILTDDAVNGWKYDIQRCIMDNCRLLIDLCCNKIDEDNLAILDLLAMVLNPHSKFQIYNGNKPPDMLQLTEDQIFAKPSENRIPARGWLVDLLNRFGKNGGFDTLKKRFMVAPGEGRPLSFPLISALVKPFGQCHEVLTVETIKAYFLPVVDIITEFLEGLSDEEMKKESKTETKNDALSAIIKNLKSLVAQVQGFEERIRELEIFRLKMILRLLKISSFNGKMNALNEVNKVIMNVSYYYQRQSQDDDVEWLTADKMASWISENEVLDIVLRDSLHQPQYVEKLEKILRFMIKEKALSAEDLDRIWQAQHGKHDAIVKNIHELLAKLAWDFSPEQLDHLFKCFQESWHHANKKQREKLLELIRRLAEDDKEGVMAQKVLSLLWTLAKADDCPTDTMDQALAALIKILDYSCTSDRDKHKLEWTYKFVEELKTNENWVLPALKQIQEICKLFTEAPTSYGHQQQASNRVPHIYYKNNVINELQNKHKIVMTVALNLTQYMQNAKDHQGAHPDVISEDYVPDGRYNHIQQVSERLRFLRFILKDGHLWLCAPQAIQIWNCLAINAVYDSDREACFKWFTKLMGEDPDLDPEITTSFFENQILRLDPSLLTESGMSCFERFFRNVNTKEENRLIERKRGLVMNDLNLVGMDYLWRVILHGMDEVSGKAISLMKELHANLGPNLQTQQETIHAQFISECFQRLNTSYDTLQCLTKDASNEDRQAEANRMIRVLTVLYEYISECDEAYTEERALLSLNRASRGKHLTIYVRIPSGQGRQEDVEIWSHTNDTLGSVKHQVLQKHKVMSNCRVELYLNGESLDGHGDKKVISQIPIRDKMMLSGKLCAINSNAASASESSSESSPTASPLIGQNDGPNPEAERCLPGVIMARNMSYIPFLHTVCDYANKVVPSLKELRDSTRNLLELSPPHQPTITLVREICSTRAQCVMANQPYNGDKLESKLFSSASGGELSPATAVYILEVIFTLLMPSHYNLTDETINFTKTFIESGGVQLVLKALTQNDFMFGADTRSKRDALLLILKISRVLLLTASNASVLCVAERINKRMTVTQLEHQSALELQDSLQRLPINHTDPMLKHICSQILCKKLMAKATMHLPDDGTIKAVQKIVWAASSSCLNLLAASSDVLQQAVQEMSGELEDDDESPDVQLACVGLEVLTLCIILYPDTISNIHQDKDWRDFIIDTLLICKNRSVRHTAQEQFQLIASRTKQNFFITLLFCNEMEKVPQYADQSSQYFSLLCLLLNWAQVEQPLSNSEARLKNEIDWLKKFRESTMNGTEVVNEALLEGHLGLARELILPLPANKKSKYGSDPDGTQLIKELMEDFLLPASKALVDKRAGRLADIAQGHVTSICQTAETINAAYDLLVALCTGCVENLELVSRTLTDMFYQGEETVLTEWEYLPPVGMRPPHGFVGLKNGGATCYMNSVFQQLFMIEEIRNGILGLEGVADDSEENELEKSGSQPPNYDVLYPSTGGGSSTDLIESSSSRLPVESADPTVSQPTTTDTADAEQAYNMSIMQQVQIIFAHLAHSKLQFYVPKGFWKQFKIMGEQVNLREQHDALEFFSRLIDSCDEALKTLDMDQLCDQVLGGSYADEKICKDCPHRYSQEQQFMYLQLEIRNHQHLIESLEQYVKGDLLEGANAYFCERCGKKVDTVKRMCVKKLPKILAIQLKRFDYDWERDCPIKFNDYFEFPRELDMEPYTVYGLSKIEGDNYMDEEGEKSYADQPTQYRLKGIVVHSGQASGGHYYSYIKHTHEDDSAVWYKFDDGEISECKMEDDEELKKECFGGEYTGEVFDHMLKRMSFRRQKRWWNAYILMYERIPSPSEVKDDQETDKETESAKESVTSDVTQSVVTDQTSLDELTKSVSKLALEGSSSSVNKEPRIPLVIERIVRRQNLDFMHNRNQFCPEHFHFIKKLLSCNIGTILNHIQRELKVPEDLEKLSFISVRLASQFLFSVGFHTKKTLRGSAADWYEMLTSHFRTSKTIRQWFADHILFSYPERFSEYLLECSSSEVRMTFAKIVAFLAHLSRSDGAYPAPVSLNLYGNTGISDTNKTLSDHLIMAVLALLKKEVPEHGRHIAQYFHLFLMYANLGPDERRQLLSLNVLGTFLQVALDEGPGPTIKYQYVELNKLYSVVSILTRCCDLSPECRTCPESQDSRPIIMNPHAYQGQPLYPVQSHVSRMLFKSKAFIKKVVEDNIGQEDTKQLMIYLCYENERFSAELLCELLWQINYTYTYEMRPYLDLLLAVLLLEDSWQMSRIRNTLTGLQEDREALFDIIHKSKNNYHKRAYQCIKMLVNLFSKCEVATNLLYSTQSIMDRWISSVEWLNEEMERRSAYAGSSGQYAYNNWSPPAQSNETSNGYVLERSQSAKMCLAKALEFCPEEVESGEADELVVDNLEDHNSETVDSTHNQTAGSSVASPNTNLDNTNNSQANESSAEHNTTSSSTGVDQGNNEV